MVLLIALGAVRTAGFPAARWAGGLALVSGLSALVWTFAEETSELTPMGAVLAPTVTLAIAVQLWRRHSRAGVVRSLTVSVTSCVLAVLPVSWLALREAVDGVHSVGLALVGVAGVALLETLPISRAVRRVGGVLVAAVAGGTLVMTVEQVSDAVPAVSAVVVTAFAGLLAAISFAVVDRLADEATGVRAPAVPPDDVSERVPHGAGHATGRQGASREPGPPAAAAEQPISEASRDSDDDAAGPGTAGDGVPPRGHSVAALLPLRVTLPFAAAGPAAYVLGRIFVG
ncbi:hypothetical protein CLV30_12248 [Haloactinopolyspora alba]|uniref:Uncharacterized protein n=1 Tax=Haloactinopolyspora alba TaxID=648780 RepID=A0A2P8DK14_9ACTN|nr:hypothetical protein CLV30_12248 [Haloactinopolyspora alba]